MNFGKTLKSIRRELDLKQIDVVKRTGLSQSVISEIESDKRPLSLDTIYLICDKLGISKEEFLIKAIFEQDVTNPKNERLLREIRPFVTNIAEALYSDLELAK